MIAWMLYSVAVALIAGLAAAAAERTLRVARRPARWAWPAAMAVSLALPLLALLPDGSVERSIDGPAVVDGVVVRPALDEVMARLAWLDAPLLLAWGTATIGTLAFLLASSASLRRFRRGLREARVDGVPVRLSRDAGPAVLGFVRGEIVLPEWALVKDEPARRLLLAHESEHLRAGDPRLLLAGLVMAALAPWNPALWWQLRRLKLSMEMDCDARVLRRGADVRAYAELLIEVSRRARPAPLAVAAFSSPASRIEKRILAMTLKRSAFVRAGAAASAVAAAGLVVLACETPQPSAPALPRPSEAPPSAAATHPRTPAPEGTVVAAEGPTFERVPAPAGVTVEGTAVEGRAKVQVQELREPVRAVAGTVLETTDSRGARVVVVPAQAAGVARYKVADHAATAVGAVEVVTAPRATASKVEGTAVVVSELASPARAPRGVYRVDGVAGAAVEVVEVEAPAAGTRVLPAKVRTPAVEGVPATSAVTAPKAVAGSAAPAAATVAPAQPGYPRTPRPGAPVAEGPSYPRQPAPAQP